MAPDPSVSNLGIAKRGERWEVVVVGRYVGVVCGGVLWGGVVRVSGDAAPSWVNAPIEERTHNCHRDPAGSRPTRALRVQPETL